MKKNFSLVGYFFSFLKCFLRNFNSLLKALIKQIFTLYGIVSLWNTAGPLGIVSNRLGHFNRLKSKPEPSVPIPVSANHVSPKSKQASNQSFILLPAFVHQVIWAFLMATLFEVYTQKRVNWGISDE